jgi:hypothetical protein
VTAINPPADSAPSGRDLARQALAEYKKRTWAIPTDRAPAAKTKRAARPTGGGRDPVGLAAVLAGLGADLPLEAGVAGGSVIDQWATLCPQYADTVTPTGYDPGRGRLDLRPANYAVASGLRLLGGQLAKQINDKMGRPVVRTIRVLPVGSIDRPTADLTDTVRPESQAPVKTREMASPGYRDALEAHLTSRTDRPVTVPGVAEAIERQNRILTHPANREPEAAFADAVAERERRTGPALSSSDRSRLAALAYKRSNQTDTPRRAFDVA